MSTVRFPNEVADRITADTWTTGWGDRQHETCLHGHVRQCDLRPGDEHLIAAVFNDGPGSMTWNDEQSSHVPVVEWARKAEITDDMLAETFGPQWLNVVGLVRRLAVMTPAEAVRLEVAWPATRIAARGAVRGAVRGAAKGAAWGAAWDAIKFVDSEVAWSASGQVAAVLVAADLTGQYGLEQRHLDTLLAPVRQVLGDPLDPDTVQEWLAIALNPSEDQT